MLRNLTVLILFSAVFCLGISAQTPPAAPKPPAKPMVFSTFFDGSYLGVQTQDVTRENFSKFGLGDVRGVAVEKVFENSPAAQAGLQVNDVIVRFNGEEITSVRKLTRLIGEVAPDHKVNMTVLRGGGEREITVTMGKREFPKFEGTGFRMEDLPQVPRLPDFERVPMPPMPPIKPLPPSFEGNLMFFGSRQIGVSVTPLTKQLADYFGVSEGKGLLIENVRENSAAAKAGLRAGDVIVEVDGKEVKGTMDLIRTLNERKEGAVNLTIIRDRSRQSVTVEPTKSESNLKEFFFDGKEGDFKFSSNGVSLPELIIKTAPDGIL
ncbi:MAG TPA: PDZ domain-containing protein [Pyrinomonadaceae bacterium]|nr:PDZ domain-containing protein [Pyrinomonadaceae bacterium]